MSSWAKFKGGNNNNSNQRNPLQPTRYVKALADKQEESDATHKVAKEVDDTDSEGDLAVYPA